MTKVDIPVLITKERKFFIVEEIKVEHFDTHISAYILIHTHNVKVVGFENVFSKWPLSIHYYNGRSAIINQYSHTCEYITIN